MNYLNEGSDVWWKVNRCISKITIWKRKKRNGSLNLDGHQKKFVSKAVQCIEEKGSEIGDALGKKGAVVDCEDEEVYREAFEWVVKREK